MAASFSITPRISDCFTAPSILIPPAQPPPDGLSSFSLFRELPAEIRLMVWGVMLPGPRLVLLQEEEYGNKARQEELEREANNQPTSSSDRPRILGLVKWRYRSPCPVPILLHICHESRAFASIYYKRHFGHICSSEPLTYFRPDLDILYFDQWRRDRRMIRVGENRRINVRCFSPGSLEEVKYFAVRVSASYGTTEFLARDLASAFGNLPTAGGLYGFPKVKAFCIIQEATRYDHKGRKEPELEPELVLLQPDDKKDAQTTYNSCCHSILSTMTPGSIPPLSNFVRPSGSLHQITLSLGIGEGVPDVRFAGVAPPEAARVVIRAKEVYFHRWQRLLQDSDPLEGRCCACEAMEYTDLSVGECRFRPAVDGDKCCCGKNDFLE